MLTYSNMSMRSEDLVRGVLEGLPNNHPERDIVFAVVGILHAYNTKNQSSPWQLMDRSISAVLIPDRKTRLAAFFGQEVDVPNPPQELSAALIRAQEIGWTQAEAHFLPKMELKQNLNFPGWTVKPEQWYWNKIKEKKVDKNAAALEGIWVIVDGSQKPQYKDGKQMYENDPFAATLAQFRKEGKIQVPDWYRNIPANSRFGISNDELQNHVNPAIANLLGVQPEQVRLPKAIEFNVLGNFAHPEWGKTNTWEWFADKFEGGFRLVGGGSVRGGLAFVDCDASGGHFDSVGFRPLVAFPPKAR